MRKPERKAEAPNVSLRPLPAFSHRTPHPYFFSLLILPVQKEERIVARRVAQRLGEWKPPSLSEEERSKLLLEREALAAEVSKLELKLEEVRGRGNARRGAGVDGVEKASGDGTGETGTGAEERGKPR